MLARGGALVLAATLGTLACSRGPKGDAAGAASGASSGRAKAAPAAPPPPPTRGMVWIPPGILVAGTPEGRVPRIADEELAGEQLVMGGFYIDEYAYPNEAGAIPRGGATQAEAASTCAAQGKRLCTELEWERACKGPESTTYEYGDTYRASECATGPAGRLSPSGMHVGCKSAFGVHDLHGGAWEWTSSAWGRGTAGSLVAVRGGNDAAGEVVGRCANASARPPDAQRGDLGFRCCAGPVNAAEVRLEIRRGKALEVRALDASLASAVAAGIADAFPGSVPAGARLSVDWTWVWRPIGNEELVLVAGCAPPADAKSCGIAVARARPEGPQLLAFAASGRWSPTLHGEVPEPRKLLLYGGDRLGELRRAIVYAWGRVLVGEDERHGPRTPHW